MKISQREARRLRRRVADLESRDNDRARLWNNQYPGGVCVEEIDCEAVTMAKLRTARKLGHYLIAIPAMNNDNVWFYAVKP
jgi:hypothetical protein